MDITIVLAQIWAIIFLVLGLSMIFNKKETATVLREAVENKGFLWLVGFVALVLGAVLVVLSNLWTSGLELLVTVLGWLTLIKGTLILLFPKPIVSLYRKFGSDNWFMAIGVIAFILGLILMYRVM